MKENECTKKYFKIIVFIFVLCFMLGCSFKGSEPSAKYYGIIDVDDMTFDQEVLHSELPVLVFFYGKRCEPCWKKMPRVKKIASKAGEKLKVCKMEVGTVYVLQYKGIPNPIISKRYRFAGVPTTIIFNKGKEVIRDVNAGHPSLCFKDINPVLEKLTELRY